MSTEKLYQTNNYQEPDITFINSEPPQITFFDWLDDKLVENKGTSFFDWLHKLL